MHSHLTTRHCCHAGANPNHQAHGAGRNAGLPLSPATPTTASQQRAGAGARLARRATSAIKAGALLTADVAHPTTHHFPVFNDPWPAFPHDAYPNIAPLRSYLLSPVHLPVHERRPLHPLPPPKLNTCLLLLFALHNPYLSALPCSCLRSSIAMCLACPPHRPAHIGSLAKLLPPLRPARRDSPDTLPTVCMTIHTSSHNPSATESCLPISQVAL